MLNRQNSYSLSPFFTSAWAYKRKQRLNVGKENNPLKKGLETCRRTHKSESTPLRKWGLPRKYFLRENIRGLYLSWLITGKLNKHLTQDCEERFELITMQMTERESVTEELKATIQMGRVQRMNSIWNRAEEIVMHELIYVRGAEYRSWRRRH